VLTQPDVPAAGAPAPGLPPGFSLPPGVELPPGMQLPPGFELPPGMTMPSGGPFIQYASDETGDVAGTNHLDIRSMPFGDPDNPNQLVGEKTTEAPVGNGKTVVKWDLVRDME
jgi:hypothetical protein